MLDTYRPTWRERMTVDVPEGSHGRATVSRTTVPDNITTTIFNMRNPGRGVRPGETYTQLHIGGALWMSDTPAEQSDHYSAVAAIGKPETRRVLINGLGLGMVVKAALSYDHVEKVTVVEQDPDVIALIGPHYLRDERVELVEADAYTVPWPAGTTWDVAWHDIWLHLSESNLEGMARLHRRYGRRVSWQGSWGREIIRAERRRGSGW